jgi:tetratricopeptide (TPR) repeat protein/transglutaminase-like putative cysteine protease
MLRRCVAVCLVALAFPLAAAADTWSVARGPSREPAPYRYDPASIKKVPRAFLDNSVAVILYAGTSQTVEKDGTVETTTHEVTRLGGRKAVEKLGESRGITWTPSYQKVTLHLARIHKPGGRVVEVQPRHVHLRDVATDYQVYDPEKQLIITFPGLEVGDVLEVKWSVRGKNPEHGGQFFNRYAFGDPQYPVMLDEYRVRLPRGRALKFGSAHGKLESSVRDAGEWRIWTWRAALCPPSPQGDDLPSREELRPSLLVSTFASWAEVGAWKHKIRAACWKCTPQVKKVVEQVVRQYKTPLERARALTYWVRRNIRYVSVGEKHDYTPHLPQDVLANRYGDCKDTSQLLAVMLAEAGVKAELATLGALDDGQVHPDVPSPWGTHAILLVTIDGKRHWIDTTTRLAGWDYLPRDDRDRLCYVTDEKGKVRLVRTPAQTPANNKVEQTTEVWTDTAGNSRCRREMVSHGSAAVAQRDRYLEVPLGDKRRQVTADLQDANSRSRLLELDIDEKALDDFGQPVRVRMTFDIDRHFSGTPDREGSVTDSRVWARLLSHNIDPDRRVPLVLPGPFESLHTYRFHLPAAFTLDSLPRGRVVRSRWGFFESKVRRLDTGDDIRDLEVVFHTRLDTPRIEVADLEEFRKFHEDVNRDYRVWLTLRPAASLASAKRLEALLTFAPQNAVPAATLARIYIKADRLADARRVLRRACYYTPDDTALWELRVQAAETPAQEEQAQRELVRRFPDRLDHALALGRILVSAGKQDEARAVLRRLTEKGSDVERARAHYQLARSHYRQDEPKEALAEWDQARKLDPATVGTLRGFVLRGQVLEELKRPKDALAAYRQALAVEGKSQTVLLSLIRLSIVVKDELSALDYLRRYVLLVANDVRGMGLAAETYLKLKHYDEAFELAMRVREQTFTEKSQRVLGLVYLHRGDEAKALFHLQKADPDTVVLAGLVRASITAGKLNDLDTYLEKMARLEKAPAGLRAVRERGLAVLKRRGELSKLVRIPAGKEGLYRAALDALACAEDLYQRRQPAAQVERLLAPALAPGLEVGPAYGLRARLELERGKLARALADAEKALTLSPRDASGHYVRGRVRQERGQAGALGEMEKAAELSGRQDAGILHGLSECLAAAGRLEDALKAAREAVKLRSDDAELAEHLAALEKAAKEKGAPR